MSQLRFAFDPNRCTGCQACAMACVVESVFEKHGAPNFEVEKPFEPQMSFRKILTFNPWNVGALPVYHLSLACNHCENPACMEQCPASAYHLDEAIGAVILNSDKCMGCKYCSWACPYDAPVFDHAEGVMKKCDFCIDRLRGEQHPACVVACPVDALSVEERVDAEKPGIDHVDHQIPGFDPSPLGPSIRFEPVRATDVGLEAGSAVGLETFRHLTKNTGTEQAKISASSEWTLLGFTWLMTVLVALFGWHVLRNQAIAPIPYLITAMAAMGLSTLHLGRKRRMYRAIFNLRKSWLSREIASISLFVGLSASVLFVPMTMDWIGYLILSVGFIALFCVDQVYRVALRDGHAVFQSGGTVLSAFFLCSISIQFLPAILFVGVIRAILVFREDRKSPVLLSVRLIGLLLPIGVVLGIQVDLIQTGFIETNSGMVLGVLFMLTELIGRIRFYQRLDVPSPRRALRHELFRKMELSNRPDPL